jgi:hypothetical protein
MKSYICLALLTLPALSHAMEKKKQKTPDPICVDLTLQGSEKSPIDSAKNNKRRGSLPNIVLEVVDLFRKKRSDISKTSTGSLNVDHLDSSSIESVASVQSPGTPKNNDMTARGKRLSRLSNGSQSPRLNIVFNSVAQARYADGTHEKYELDVHGNLTPIFMGDMDDEDILPASIQYHVDPTGRKNPDCRNPRDRVCKSPDSLPKEVKQKVITAEGQCPVGPNATGTPQRARKTRYLSAAKAASVYRVAIPEEDGELRYQFTPQDSKFSYHVGDDEVDPAIAALAAKAAVAKRQAHGLDEDDGNLDHLIAMVQSTNIASSDDDDE